MRQLKLKKLEDLSYKDLLITIVGGTTDPKGMTIEEIRDSLKVLEVLESKKDGDTLELEDSYFEVLKNKVKNAHFNKASKSLVELFDDLGL